MPRRERPVVLERMKKRTFLSKKYSPVKFYLNMLTFKVRPRLPEVRTVLLFCMCSEMISQVLPHHDFMSWAAHHGSGGRQGNFTMPALQRRSSEGPSDLPGSERAPQANWKLLATSL